MTTTPNNSALDSVRISIVCYLIENYMDRHNLRQLMNTSFSQLTLTQEQKTKLNHMDESLNRVGKNLKSKLTDFKSLPWVEQYFNDSANSPASTVEAQKINVLENKLNHLTPSFDHILQISELKLFERMAFDNLTKKLTDPQSNIDELIENYQQRVQQLENDVSSLDIQMKETSSYINPVKLQKPLKNIDQSMTQMDEYQKDTIPTLNAEEDYFQKKLSDVGRSVTQAASDQTTMVTKLEASIYSLHKKLDQAIEGVNLKLLHTEDTTQVIDPVRLHQSLTDINQSVTKMDQYKKAVMPKLNAVQNSLQKTIEEKINHLRPQNSTAENKNKIS